MTDDELAAELAAAFPDLRAPREVTEAAKGLFTWRTIDAELAALVEDSLVDEEPALTRAADRLRSVTFEGADTAVVLEIDAGARRAVGQLDPASAATIELTGSDPRVTVTADGLGRFILPLPPAGTPLALRLQLPDGRVVVTGPLAV
ncbi:hypothetical protein [Pseudonocardia xishanensis]|uniref:Uncharacterized protein n=1 Tax=Pseudonocardia xishanensis TaxID=630995 RepID=A0ABP8RQ23_9PSEU